MTRYYVNLYQVPESLQSECPEADNVEIGELCRSAEEAMEQAAFNQLYQRECYTQTYICTLNDPLTTKMIQSYIKEVEKALAGLRIDLEETPATPEETLDAWRRWQESSPTHWGNL